MPKKNQTFVCLRLFLKIEKRMGILKLIESRRKIETLGLDSHGEKNPIGEECVFWDKQESIKDK